MIHKDENEKVAPILIVTRLIVKRRANYVYDQKFKLGVNIIRGDNTTGKSTIIDLLYYGLGAEITDWTDEQELCEETIIEVMVNYKKICLKREITETGKAPMFVFDGNFDAASKDNIKWFRYPNARSKDTHSYSQQLFELLGLPSHKTESANNLTMHQILRLMYVDQLSEPTKLLKEDKKHDNGIIRRAIGEYLLGIDDLEAHNIRQAIIIATRRFDALKSELKAIYKFVGSNTGIIRREHIQNEIITLQKEIDGLNERRQSIRQSKLDTLSGEMKERANEISEQLKEAAHKKYFFDEKKSTLNAEIIDTKLFLESLNYRKNSLEQSKTTNSELGDLIFQYCPACLSPIEKHSEENHCGLCKADMSQSEHHYQYIQMVNEINFQIRESSFLIEEYNKKVELINSEIPSLSTSIKMLKEEFSEITSNADAVDAALSDIGSQIGFNKSQIATLNEKMETVEQIEGLVERKEIANGQIGSLENKLDSIQEANKDRYAKVYSSIEKIAIKFIKADGGYEKVFNNPEEVSFDFSRDKMAVNGRSKFSASSMVVLKNAIRASIFIHSVNDKSARLPRFLLMDNIEDKGMVAERSQNFQRVLVGKCDELTNDYQLIFTTSMIDPELNHSDYVVGPFYKKGEHTLNFKSAE